MGTNARHVGAMSKAIAAELRAELARHQYSIRHFAATHTLPLSTLHKNISGKRAIDVEDLYLICNGLGISITTLITRAEQAITSHPTTTMHTTPEHTTRDDVPTTHTEHTHPHTNEHTP